MTGMNQRAYAGYEYARSQVNYVAARRILIAFPILNPIWWVNEGKGPMLQGRVFFWPSAKDLGVGPRAPFSRVYDTQLRQPLGRAPITRFIRARRGFRVFTGPSDLWGRLVSKEKFGDFLSQWLAARPDSLVNDFMNDLFLRAAQVAARYPREKKEEIIEQRLAEIARIEGARRFGGGVMPSAQEAEGQKELLTGLSIIPMMPSVKRELNDLRVRLKHLTQQRGKKTELARWLPAPLESVSRWLAGTIEPSGRIALRLLDWAEQQERLTKQSAPAAQQRSQGKNAKRPNIKT